MALSYGDLYKAHVLNLRSVDAGIAQTERQLRAAISRCDESATKTLLFVLLLLSGSWAECRLRKLLFEPNGFSAADRQSITSSRTQLDWWKSSVELGFRKRHNIKRANLVTALPVTPRLRYLALIEALENDLRPIIEMRNTLAHGQWARPLNSDCTDISGPMIVALNNENALSARFKLTILDKLSAVVHDLVAGNHAFERDFDRHFDLVENARRNLSNRSYDNWKAAMQRNYQSGLVKRNGAIQVENGNAA
jgi:hypothetical protein